MGKKGLIKAIRSENNYRLFDKQELVRLYKKSTTSHTNTADNNYKILINPSKTTYTSIELFAGAGGTALGFEHAGIQHILLNEIDRDCALTLKKNRPNWNIIHQDVKKLDYSGITTDIVQGRFPCQAFSYAGKKHGFEDTRGTLFFEFARCIKEVQPKIAIGENVRGLLNHDKGRTLDTMLATLKELGYKAQYKVLRSQYLDVPQKRERLIIIAVRNDLNTPIIFPDEQNYTISLREALDNCPPSSHQVYSVKKKKIMDLIPEGGYWRNLPIELQKEYMGASFFMGGGKTGMARRLSWDEPSLTLTCNPAQKQTERCHPTETRPLSIREYARIQTFPDSWEFVGSTASQYKQIGNAVPVNLGYHIGMSVIQMLDQMTQNQNHNIEKPHLTNYTPLFNNIGLLS